jgi:hypothetical protein
MTHSERPLERLGQNSTLARDTAGTSRAVDSIERRIDKMVMAVGREDWMTLGKMGRRLARKARAEGYRAISAYAERVCDEATNRGNPLGIKRSMIRLLGVQARTPRRGIR